MDLLRLRGRGHLARANGPDRLVGNNDIGPLLGADRLRYGTELFSDDGDGVALLALLERLATAQDDADVLVEGVLCLRGDELVVFLEDDATLGVPNQGPSDFGVLKLSGGDLAGIGTFVLVEDVLGRNFDVLAQLGAREKEVDGGRGDDDLCGYALDVCIRDEISDGKKTHWGPGRPSDSKGGMLLHSQTGQSWQYKKLQFHHVGKHRDFKAGEAGSS